MKRILVCLLLLCSFFWDLAQNKAINKGVGVLGLGGRVPEMVMNGVVNYPVKSLRLSAFRDKLLIVDFWATSCGACIALIPHLEALQQQHKASLKIVLASYENQVRILNFLKARPDIKVKDLPIIAGDTLLQRLFPHQYIPHVVWIYKGAFIRATGAEFVTEKNIATILRGRIFTSNQKTDLLNFNYRKPLFPVSANSRLGKTRPFYTTAFSGFISGLPLGAGMVTDTLRHNSRYYVINHSIVQLYSLALNSGLPLLANRRILPGENPEAYCYQKTFGYYDTWARLHCFCYELTYPESASPEYAKERMRTDLNQIMQLDGAIENRKIPCLVLTVVERTKLKTTTGPVLIEKNRNGAYTALDNVKTADLAYILSSLDGFPPVLDETGKREAISLHFPHPPLTIADWESLLSKSGLLLKKTERMMPMFILRRTGNGPVAAASLPLAVN
jgi:thiol-disulfide isomerase/thioredoxin